MKRILIAAFWLALVAFLIYETATVPLSEPCHFVGNTCITNPQPN